jgi:3-oxoacyl-[acyl-carrier protein] reductase
MGQVLNGRVAIVTGSGRGIGQAIALAMAREGAQIITNDCDFQVAEAVAEDITRAGGQAVSFTGDISHFEVARRLIQKAVDSFGKVDVLVNNAGITARHVVWEMAEEPWDSMIAIHLKGSFNCIRHACPIMMKQKWGRIINTTSIARIGVTEHCNYGAAKAGIVGLTKAVALDLAGYGITCNAYGPAAATRMTLSDEIKARFERALASGAITQEFYDQAKNLPPPERIPPFLIYLCTDKAANINGLIFEISRQKIEIRTEVTTGTLNNKEDIGTIEELEELVPKVLLKN